MAAICRGPRKFRGGRDHDGYRSYWVTYLVEVTPGRDSLPEALVATGLPQPGDIWALPGGYSSIDNWVTCKLDANVSIHQEREGDPPSRFLVEVLFSNKPDERRCKTQQIEDPLLQPPDISGSFVKFSQEAVRDRFGNWLHNSAFEQIRGPHVEFDAGKSTIKIGMNVPQLNYPLLAFMMNTLNTAPLWGMPPRYIKMEPPSWSRKFWGQCEVYYRWELEFTVWVNPDGSSGWDRDLPDHGTMALYGRWNSIQDAWTLIPVPGYAGTPNPNPLNPAHYIRYTDRNGNPAPVILDGEGVPTRPDRVQSVVVDTQGRYPNNVPLVTFSGGGGTGATAHAVMIQNLLDQSSTQFRLQEIIVDDGGSGYSSPPTVNLTTFTIGQPATVHAVLGTGPGNIHVEYYNESDLLILGVPTTF